jgi:hypothetical protein
MRLPASTLHGAGSTSLIKRSFAQTPPELDKSGIVPLLHERPVEFQDDRFMSWNAVHIAARMHFKRKLRRDQILVDEATVERNRPIVGIELQIIDIGNLLSATRFLAVVGVMSWP